MKTSPFYRRSFLLGALCLSALLPRAQAALISGYEYQLETWLGQGNLSFTRIFEKGPGDTAASFHAAADGQGSTFTLMSVSGSGFLGQIIGGYNPQSWNNTSGWNFTVSDAERTAFIYNLTSSTIQRQNLIGQGSGCSDQFQTYNDNSFGPWFGAGQDLYVRDYLLNSGSAYQESFGGPYGVGGIVNRSVGLVRFSISALEVYTFSQGSNSVPDGTSTNVMIAFSLVGLIALRRRFVRA